MPFQSDIRDAYQALDIVVHASTQPEPFGLTIVEAMACGKPVIVAAHGGAIELFEDGTDALGHEPGNGPSLTHAMRTLVEDPQLRTRLGANARKSVINKFSKERFVETLKENWKRLKT